MIDVNIKGKQVTYVIVTCVKTSSEDGRRENIFFRLSAGSKFLGCL